MPKRRSVCSMRCADSGSGILTCGLPRKPSGRPRFATAARLPFSSAALSAALASWREMPSSCASALALAVTSSIDKNMARMELRIRAASRCGEGALADAGLLRLLIGVIGRAHQRPDGGMPEAKLGGARLESPERCRLDVALDRQVMRRGLQILADGQHVDLVRA